ncbi:hypothetical protein [Verrucosispora sioxanthis]|uniref:hypothetical protein n=1 Tax=Verrucosispora sioxanthis TaxID=2499994 RepID=UPI001C1246AA|nr:hypothetical protein [Verrucosispora sioxanthis]
MAASRAGRAGGHLVSDGLGGRRVAAHGGVRVGIDLALAHRGESEQRRRSVLGERGGQPIVTVQHDVAVEAADPPEQHRRQDALPELLPIGLDPTVAGAGQRAKRQDLPVPVPTEPVDPAPMLRQWNGHPPLGCPGVRLRGLAGDDPATGMQRAVAGPGQRGSEVMSPPSQPGTARVGGAGTGER